MPTLHRGSIHVLTKALVLSVPIPPFGFGDDQISIFAEVPDMVVPCKKIPSFFAVFVFRIKTDDNISSG